MSDKPVHPHPLLDMWLRTHTAVLEAQKPYWESVSNSLPSRESDEAARSAQDLWDKSLKECRDWITAAFQHVQLEDDPDDIAKTTLAKVMDPSQFLLSGSDEVNSTFQRLVDGPEFFDAAKLCDLGMQATKEWAVLREASAAYRKIVLQAWWAACETFLTEHSGDLSKVGHSPNDLVRDWLRIANEEITKAQRTERFLKSQRQLLRAGVDYRLKEQELVEKWCEKHSVPTRSEVDEIHQAVYELKKSNRNLAKLVAVQASSKTFLRKLKSPKSSGGKK